jgi:hypothetical protein
MRLPEEAVLGRESDRVSAELGLRPASWVWHRATIANLDSYGDEKKGGKPPRGSPSRPKWLK